MLNKETWSNWVEVDLKIIEDNVHYLHQYTGVQIMAIVKANGYGHGAPAIAKAAIRGGATWLGVARIEEGLELRSIFPTIPILLLGYTPPAKYQSAIVHDLSLTIWNSDQLNLAHQTAQDLKRKAKVHLKVDTGMSRLGVQADNGLKFAQQIVTLPQIEFEGLFTHFARADESDPEPTNLQVALFQELVEKIKAHGIYPKVIHTANSAASITRPETFYNLVRTGILIYGLDPSDECPAPHAIHPALSWKSVISQVKILPAGRGISYGHEYTTSKPERVGTVPVGYADGFRRTKNNILLVSGTRVPVIGRVCMDQIVIQLDLLPWVQEGDEVILLGCQGEDQISAEELATRWNTNNYDVVCGIGQRVPRIYIESNFNQEFDSPESLDYPPK